MYTLKGYPVDVGVRRRKTRERAEWRRRRVVSLRRLVTRAFVGATAGA